MTSFTIINNELLIKNSNYTINRPNYTQENLYIKLYLLIVNILVSLNQSSRHNPIYLLLQHYTTKGVFNYMGKSPPTNGQESLPLEFLCPYSTLGRSLSPLQWPSAPHQWAERNTQ